MLLTNLNLTLALPEIIVLIAICAAILIEGLTRGRQQQFIYLITQVAVIASFITSALQFNTGTDYAFFQMYIHNPMVGMFKIFIEVSCFFAFIFARDYLQNRNVSIAEFYILGLFSLLGMLVLVSANSLLVLFLGLEILSLPLYVMTALRRDFRLCTEAAMKYFVTGAIATAFFLYGISILYGATDSLNIEFIAKLVQQIVGLHALIFYFALVFIVAGMIFKIGAAPFHMWVPDVYQGAPTPVTLFISSAPKIAALGLIVRILVDALPSLLIEWQQLLIFVAVASLILGNVVAIVQSNLKRMLAYSSIAQMGYMLLGLISGTAAGYSSSLFYIFVYALAAMAAFAILTLLSVGATEIETIHDLKGLNTRNPWLAFLMLLVMFSMAGVPPTAGFFAKLGVFEALISTQHVWLAVLAIIFSVIGAYYYLAVVKVMYFEEPADSSSLMISAPIDIRLAVTVNSIAMLAIGLFPTVFIDLCRAAFQ